MAKQIRFLPLENIHGTLLPWVIGVMVFLSGMAIAVSVALQGTASSWQADLSRQLTVQIVHADRDVRAQEASAALEKLQALSGIDQVEIAGDDEIEALLEPWLGEGNVSPELPVPTLIRVTLSDESPAAVSAIAAAIADVAPSARVDSHEQWLSDLLTLARIIQWISVLIVMLVMVATVAIIIFATRSGLAAQRETVEVVHTIGAPDGLIANAFQRRFLTVGLRGGLYGLGILAVVFLLILLGTSGIESSYLPGMIPSMGALVILLLLPVPAALITMLTARYTVLRALREMV